MPRKKMLWQLILPYLAVIILSLVAITWYSFSQLRDFYYKQVALDLQSKAFLIQNQFKELLADEPVDFHLVDSLCKQQGTVSSTRLTVMLPDGKVIGDTHEEPAVMENHAYREEMQAALNGEVGSAVRLSNTIQQNMMYLAVPLYHNGNIIGVLRTSMSVAAIESTLNELIAKLSIALLVIIILASFISSIISKRISRPLEELKQGAEMFARGEFQHRLLIPDSEEIGRLAESMNMMAAQLDERIKMITSQRNEQRAILSSMVEGVVAVNMQEHIINMNDIAAEMLDIDKSAAYDRPIQEVIRNHELEQMIQRTLDHADTNLVEGEIVLTGKGERFVQVNSSVLKNADGDRIGALVVLNDLTRLRRLESVRTDFVANVSHELKTPITSIKGFVETLLDGAKDDPHDAERFLLILNKQADRLNAIIDDLLALSRLEQEANKGEISFDSSSIPELIDSVVQVCRHKADAKKIEIVSRCPDQLNWRINAPLLEQAVVNLLDNAIKYSTNDKKISLSVEQEPDRMLIHVTDEGPGIASNHLPRLFERFYRVDKARSREMGGTGLGLAIVKHIANTHNGKIKVTSKLGKGSTFTLEIPAR